MRRRDLVTASLALPLFATRPRAAPLPATPPVPVVLELFTSQGCSSCPPADALLGQLVRQPGIIGLAWHVDYWNRLGWRDPYARPEWTERQQTYARALSGDVYTPALVVNGAALMVGSDERAIRQAIQKSPPPPLTVTLRRGPSGLEGGISPTATPVSALLISYDPQQTTQIGSGENGGRRLTEYRVVRDALALEKLASAMTFPMVPEDRGAVLLVRDAAWRVVGAAEVSPVRA